MRLVLTILITLLAIAYVLALGVLVVGGFGFFGVAPSPLAGVYLVPLGLPWILFVDHAGEALRPWLGIAAPLVNIAILVIIRRRLD